MSKSKSIQRFLARAEEKERKFDWLGAVELSKMAFNEVLKRGSLWEAGEIGERIGFCFHRAAMQGENTSEFSDRMHLAIANYEEARGFFERTNEPGRIPRILRSNAMIAYSGFWLTSDMSEKKRLLTECWKLTKQTLAAFREAGDALEYGITYNNLSSGAFFRYTLEWKFRLGKNIVKEAMEYGEQAINFLSGIAQTYDLARAYAKTGIWCSTFGRNFIPDMCERETYRLRGQDYWRKAIELFEEAALLELSGVSSIRFDEMNWTMDEMLDYYCKALDCSMTTGDKYLIGTSLEAMAFASTWKGMGTSDPDRRLELFQTSLHYLEEAKRKFSLISFSSPRCIACWTESPQGTYDWIAASWEMNIKKRLVLLKSAITHGIDAVKMAEKTGYPGINYAVHQALSRAMGSHAQIETNAEEKRKILKKALNHRKKAFSLVEHIFPFGYWGHGVNWKFLADLKVELSKLEKSPMKRKKLLKEAVSHQEMGLQLLMKEIAWEKTEELSNFTSLARAQYSHGESLILLYESAEKKEHLTKAVRAFEEAAKAYGKLGMASFVAECCWKIAQTYDILTEHLKASESFRSASENYKIASRQIPQLASFYSDYAFFMRAWADIEKSRHEHENENYSKSGEHYHSCSRYLEMTKKWRYLSPYYSAWSILEHGEALSRLDKPQDAVKAFNEAGQTFGDSANSLPNKIRHFENFDERDETLMLANIAELRRQYCTGRALMEEAVISNMKGDRISSSKKYSYAAEVFKAIEPNFGREEDREDMRFASAICEACEKMELAEDTRDAALYNEAAELFTKASEFGHRKIAELTAKGNSCFCKALAMGMKFMATSNLDFYSAAKLRMENATGYFQRAGVKKLASYVEAVKKHFDAYVYMGKAEAETEPEKRAKFYLMAERCLKLSAGFFGKAGYRDKKNEVIQNLESVRKERQFATSLGEVLMAPTVLSGTTGFSMPGLTEKAAGLNGFESVNIRASVSVPRDFVPGKKFEVKLDLANVGKTPGLLVRIEGLVPPECTVLSVPFFCVLEDTSLNMRGRRLEPLSVESISVWVQITDIAGVTFSPCVVYVDEIGTFRTTQVEEVEVFPVFEFESKVAQAVFNFLVDAFVEDCIKHRLAVDRSGWRSFPQIIKGAGVSKRSLYGTGGRLGHGLSGSQKNGLVNLETLIGERGRGGHILRVRIRHEKESVRRYVREKAPDFLA